ncbi:Amino-acid acetyltransferase [Sulfurospirillum diekertiae]|uniref:Amino-acid acetyltransferase n=1 Tax=Sulfurospirillum diekertiae TaxID=1854492 RepID=A0A290HEP3_9BACT|nr:arsenic resistance N-acetyltransferase ArsN2 [Sulfurospirillum diekertiae]ATB70003.1 Amino-acid acetyltransferase [Sulfurospirillum diekertiae]
MEMHIRKAIENEYRAITHLLASNQLPTADIYEKNITLFVGLIDEKIVATIGIETYGNEALLRSLCVKEGFKNQKLGEKILTYLISFCATANIQTVYLLTTTAEHYFERYGFEKIGREKTPQSIQNTREFQDICPSSAIIMALKL